MAASTFIFRLLVIFLGISHLMICFNNAIPITRIGRLMHEPQLLPAVDEPHMAVKEKTREEEMIEGRMAVQLNDYPGSGANNRHTPRPPQYGRCVDC